MREFTDKCIVLNVSDYRDDDRLCKVITADNGLITVLFRGVKKPKAKLKPFAQPFTVFDSKLTLSRGVFFTAIEPLIISDGFTLSADLRAFAAANVCAEATVAAIGDDEPHGDMFVEFLKLLKAVEFNGDPYYQAAAYMCALMKLSGFYREYNKTDNPQTPVQMLGLAQSTGYIKREESDLSRRALKYACSEFQKYFDCGLKSVQSVDLY